MIIKYNIEVSKDTIAKSLTRLTNQTYKLLPNWEEGIDWIKPLETIIEEFVGMSRLLLLREDLFFTLLCKLEGLFVFVEKDNFFLFRRSIFDCLGLINEIKVYIDKEI